MFTKSNRFITYWLSLLMATSIVIVSCVGSIHYKLFCIRGDTFHPNNTIEYNRYNYHLWISMGSSKKPINDSLYNVSIRIGPRFMQTLANSSILNKAGIDSLMIKRRGLDSSFIKYPKSSVEISECGSRYTDVCKRVKFQKILIPNYVDSLDVFIAHSVEIDGESIKRDTTVSLFRADGKHTGVIDH